MSFKRIISPSHYKSGEDLTRDLVGIGFCLAGKPNRNANIEDTLVAASLEGLSGKDGRVLSLLVDWLGIHHSRINADRLTRLVLDPIHRGDGKFLIFWSAVFQWISSDFRFRRLRNFKSLKAPYQFLDDRTEFLIQKNGEDERFRGTCLRIPAKVLRHRPEDVLSPKELAQTHIMYRYRVMMGPSYRADMWAVLINDPGAKPSEIARMTYGSYPTAHAVKRDFEITKGRRQAA